MTVLELVPRTIRHFMETMKNKRLKSVPYLRELPRTTSSSHHYISGNRSELHLGTEQLKA